MWKRPKVALALGAGGARGIAHIGVLKVFDRSSIPIDFIAGASIGALVGAAYAINPDGLAIENRVRTVLGSEDEQNNGLKRLQKLHLWYPTKSDLIHRIARIAEKGIFLNLAMVKNALLSEKNLRECIETFLPDKKVTDTLIPFVATAVDLISGKEIVLNEGSLQRAVMASCATPGYMPPVEWDGMLLVDGGVVGDMPIEPAKKMGADIVIGVDVDNFVCRPRAIDDGIDVINRTMEIMGFCLNRRRRENADLLIEPDVKEMEWTDFFEYDKLVAAGETAALLKIDEIRKMLVPGVGRKAIPWPKKFLPAILKKSEWLHSNPNVGMPE